LQARLESLKAAEAAAAASAPPVAASAPKSAAAVAIASVPDVKPVEESVSGVGLPEPVAGEGWSSDSLNSGGETGDVTETDPNPSQHSLEDPEDEESSNSNS